MKWCIVLMAVALPMVSAQSCPGQQTATSIAATRTESLSPPWILLRSVNHRLIRHNRPGSRSVIGEMGDQYEIRITNPNHCGTVALVSVDGLSVFTGLPARMSDPGYVIPAEGSVVVRGWRRGDEHAAAFRFTTTENSYAKQMGYGEHIGQIRVTLIREQLSQPRTSIPTWEHGFRSGGTEYGPEIDDRVTRINFRRSNVTSTWLLNYSICQQPSSSQPVLGKSTNHFVPEPPGYSN